MIKRAPFSELEQRYSLTKFDNLLHANTLNTLKDKLVTTENGIHLLQRGQASSGVYQHQRGQASRNDFGLSFKCQNSMSETDGYYETIIFKNKVIPTRPNSWHDLFNGLIWLSFPNTKTLLNQWHVEDIQAHGLTPRTQRRNQITLFDECGIILAVSDSQVCEYLANHQWQKVFIEDRHKWVNHCSMLDHDVKVASNKDGQIDNPQIKAFVFGHANYEMLLNPFIGLTGKWLAIRVNDSFFSENYAQQLSILDLSLYHYLLSKNSLSNTGKLPPIPLLGIPSWYPANRYKEFYLNEEYFRPARN
ncbi:DUF3025 domain-containing protein [Aliiglaciecola sp. 3_MG-2023]|uniref:DUF3025 domain-containing protein n=1 Tax=Aliiglaciecola sp. 3_MG-2023 TaxID=3062644 RepID=UPI0026E42552|nr:DUF3025 domain-containing protein [Aliiglaciecola sp. 3_MG-2023]MDO6695585.1 DUF3025 domain-containing protein [Aliiglaciecola sp. 3_MG-2023]